MRKVLLFIATVAAFTAISGVVPFPSSGPSSRSVGLEIASDGSLSVESGLAESLVALQWESGSPGVVRYRFDSGQWNEWALQEDHGPDVGPAQTGTIALYTASASSIEISTENPLTGASLFVVDDLPDSGPIQLLPTAAAAVDAPPITSREAWGGAGCEDYSEEGPAWTNRVRVIVVHHTSGTNAYTPDQVPGIIQGICEYHTSGNGWVDIGYNFLIDQFGVIYEGRRADLNGDMAVGAHSRGLNSQTVGVALIGDFRNTPPTVAAQESLIALTTWLSEQEHVDPFATMTLTDWEGAEKELAGLSGHSDISITSCPGAYCYALFPDFRDGIEANAGPRIFIDALSSDHPNVGDTLAATFSFTEPMNWVFKVSDQDGTQIASQVGSGITVDHSMVLTLGMEEIFFELEATTPGGYSPPPLRMSWHKHYVGLFSDDDESPYVVSIEKIAMEAITLGCTPGEPLFCPHDVVTREQMAAFIGRALDLPPSAQDFFDDDNGSVLEPEINAFAASGITLGCTETSFCPQEIVPREQMAAFLARALGLAPSEINGFEDVSGFFTHEINAMAAAGIIAACNEEGTLFCPTQDVTREDMALFLDLGFLTP